MKGEYGVDDMTLWVVRAIGFGSAVALALGLLMHFGAPDAAMTDGLFAAGLIMLMSVPAVRMVAAVADGLSRRDFQFALMAVVVLLELTLSLWYAARV